MIEPTRDRRLWATLLRILSDMHATQPVDERMLFLMRAM